MNEFMDKLLPGGHSVQCQGVSFHYTISIRSLFVNTLSQEITIHHWTSNNYTAVVQHFGI